VVNTIDDFLQILADRDVNSEVLASLPKGAAVELGEASQFDGREWMQATVKEGTSGFVLAPSARGHTTLASERPVPAGIALTDKRARENRPDPLAGVGGWLILLLVGLLLTPVLTVYAVAVFGEIWTDPWFLTSAIGGGAIAGSSLLVAVALLNRWPTAPRLAQALLITSWIFWSGLYLMVGITGGSTQFATAVVFSIPSTILWVRYFAVSWRVHVTYGPMPVGRLRLRPAAALSIITAIAVCLGGIVIANHRRQLWSNFRSEEGFYSVDAPGEPRRSSLPDGTTQVLFGNDIHGFAVLYAATPEGVNTQTYLEKLRDKTINNVNGSVVSTSQFTNDGYSGLEFNATFQAKGATGDLFGRVYRAGTKGFLLLVSGPQGGRTASDAGRFFRSFQMRTSQ
jgi:hypothetical protein